MYCCAYCCIVSKLLPCTTMSVYLCTIILRPSHEAMKPTKYWHYSFVVYRTLTILCAKLRIRSNAIMKVFYYFSYSWKG